MKFLSTVVLFALATQCMASSPERKLLRSGSDTPVDFSTLAGSTASDSISEILPSTDSTTDTASATNPLSSLTGGTGTGLGDLSSLTGGGTGGLSSLTGGGTSGLSSLTGGGLSGITSGTGTGGLSSLAGLSDLSSITSGTSL